jgi:hypothetical protein
MYRLEDGREFRSPSSAASAVMGGTAANGWRFWSLEGDTPQVEAEPAPGKARKARKPKVEPEAVATTEDVPASEAAATE